MGSCGNDVSAFRGSRFWVCVYFPDTGAGYVLSSPLPLHRLAILLSSRVEQFTEGELRLRSSAFNQFCNQGNHFTEDVGLGFFVCTL
ncbi:hypothetical protein [Bartonella sp. CL2QHWL]|uniref:hypothetical protein n=1 Tax=Bartonella sp. CL2QHWL TaxID=3243523 RepID=UPI0035D0231D